MAIQISYSVGSSVAKNPQPASLPEKLQQALTLHKQGHTTQARAIYQEILRADPDHSDALHLLGLIAAQGGHPQLAADLMGKALESNPRNVAAYCNRATVLKSLGHTSAALDSYDRAIGIAPDLAEAHLNRGLVLQELKRLDEALVSFHQVIKLEPDYAEAHLACGRVLQELDQLDAALASCDRAIALVADYEDAYVGRGSLLHQLGRLDAALASYDRAIALKPDHATAYHSRSFTSLLLGDFEKGWAEYEWRWKDGSNPGIREKRDFTQPRWLGKESIAGKRILLYSEQGLGDTLQFCRYVRYVADLGAQVVLEVQEPLRSLLDGLEGASQVVTRGENLPQFDYQCPLLSLPLAFNTRFDSVPSPQKYLASDATKVAVWRTRLGAKTRGRIGLVWSGNPLHKNDHNRSILLADLLRYLPAEFQYVSLQKDVRESDRQTLQSNPAILNFSDDLQDFSDTAALCDCMDAIISVDTSVAHLSGALGKDTWILLPVVPDWRWLLDRDDSPWYPRVKLYRQKATRDWHGVLDQMSSDLLRRYNL